MSFATTAAIVGTIGAVGSLGATAYSLSGAGQPQAPNEAASSAALARTTAGLLPIQRGMQAAAQTGGQYTFSLPQGASAASLGIQSSGGGWYDANGNLVSTDPNYQGPDAPTAILSVAGRPGSRDATGPGQPARASAGGLAGAGGLTWRPGTTTINGVPITRNADGSYTIDFGGIGTAQAAATEARQNAASQLALQQQYDPQFIATALQQEQQADPEGFAARQEENNLVEQQANAPLNEPVSTMLNSQIQDTLNAASQNGLTATDLARLNAATANALASRGGAGPAANFEQPLTTGFAGEQRQANAATAANGFLSSGSDPEDIEYRRVQQNLENLAAEANGQTPSSQFTSLSGAANGPAQMSQGGQLPLMTDNGASAQQIGMQNWQTQMANANNQVNPWLAGATGMLQLGTALMPRPNVSSPTLLTPSNPVS